MSKPFDKNKPFVMRTTVWGDLVDSPARLLADDFNDVKFNKDTGMQEPTLSLIVAVSGDTISGVPVDRIYKFPQDGGQETAMYRLVNIPEKRTAWVNLYDDWTTSCMYSTEDWAKSSVNDRKRYLKTVKVEWEE